MIKPYGFIYITTNIVNNKKYIGQKVYDKDNKWVTYLGSGVALSLAIKKYGKNNFHREIIEECFSKEQLDKREKYWISYYDAVNSKLYYNIASGGDGGNTYAGKSADELKQISEKMSLSRKGILNQKGNNPKSKKVICLNDMKIFECCSDAEDFYGLRKESVCSVCNPNRISKTIYCKSLGKRLQFEYYENGKKYTFKEYKRNYCPKAVKCLETNVTYDSAKEAQKILGINSMYITKCCNGILKSTNGMHFCYV